MSAGRVRRAAAGVLAATALVLTGAGACDDGGPGVAPEGEQGDGFGSGTEQDPEDTEGEGGGGDEVGGGG